LVLGRTGSNRIMLQEGNKNDVDFQERKGVRHLDGQG
jgi:hypothetical protein